MEKGDGHPQGRRHDRAVRQLRRLRRRREWLKGPGRFSVRGPFCVMGRWCCCCAGFRVCVGALGAISGGGGRGARGRARCTGKAGGGVRGALGGRGRARRAARWPRREGGGVVVQGGGGRRALQAPGIASGCREMSGRRVRRSFWLRFRGVRPCASGARRRRRTSRSREGPTWQTKRRNARRA